VNACGELVGTDSLLKLFSKIISLEATSLRWFPEETKFFMAVGYLD